MRSTRIVIAPDSFKGSLSAADVAQALASGLHGANPDLELTLAPMADGGEGLLDCVAAACDGYWHTTRLTAIHGKPIQARWYQLADDTAVIESAEVLGLPLIEQTANAPPLAQRSSAALGELVQAALDAGARQLIVGLGGSACNDAGMGVLVALGAKALDAHGNPLSASMENLQAVAQLELSGLDSRLGDLPIRVFCDVDNPLLGVEGASRIYGPQKGLTPGEIDAVEAAIERMARSAGAEAEMTLPGSGAAGGLGFAWAVLGGKLESGAQALMQLTGLLDAMADADYVVTGEGRSDRQTLSGKLPLAVARAAHPTPTCLVCGAIAEDARDALEQTFARCLTLVDYAGSVEAALAEPARWLNQIGGDLSAPLGTPNIHTRTDSN